MISPTNLGTVGLLQLICDVAGHVDLSGRRKALLEGLLVLISADAGWWSWGHGHPVRSAVTPAAIIDVGFTPEQLAAIIEGSLDPECDRILRMSVVPHLLRSPRHTSLRSELVDDATWYASGIYRNWKRAGLDDFVHCVHYFDSDVWSNCFFLRKADRPRFEAHHRQLIEDAMAGVKWLHVGVEEAIPPAVLSQLTARQRTVLLLMLDGLPRKEIAKRLHISDHTVHEHMKQLYSRFEVNSATELSARFLRSQR